MGMYSYFSHQDIEVTDKKIVSEVEAIFDDMGLIEDSEIDFGNWDGHKLEGYWYEETRKILIALAKGVEGYAEFNYEEGYSFRICFEKGVVSVKIQPSTEWADIVGDEL